MRSEWLKNGFCFYVQHDVLNFFRFSNKIVLYFLKFCSRYTPHKHCHRCSW